ncbi:type II toxin-antitoxin system RelE/ParE family toxin [Nocardia sp. NPDC004151]|uniref:type II toxin-antitoxin system RelE/ParE family toxin n=1 Tax=Nocardia sp. NPDC004151 TaxID=3364304 RepID=UPI0036A15D32
MGLYAVEVEPEVAEWLRSLSDRDFGRVDTYVGMLAENAETLGEPWSRNLGDGVRELRFHLHPREMRITYWLAPDRRVVLLTVFRKTRMRETAEVDRAKALRKMCESEHEHARNSFDRKVDGDG